MALTAALAVVLGACAVPVDTRPEEIPAQELPPDLQAPPSPPPSLTVRPEQAATVQLFFVRGDRLAPVTRQVAGAPSLPAILDQLVAGPASAEAVSGIRSAINPRTRIRRALLANGVASVDVSEPFVQVEGEDQIAAVAQLVFSCTALPGVERVRFLLEGRPVEVPAGDGTLTRRPLSRADFAALAPP